MDLGSKLLQARHEAGLSQRQLCGDVITRNMLSQIEHGTAKPSMQTLQYLAQALGKPLSFFLEEEAAVSHNQAVMQQARKLFDRAQYSEVMKVLSEYRAPDELCDFERAFIACLSLLSLAETGLAQNKIPLAQSLLEEAAFWEHELWAIPELRYRRVRLQARLRGQNLTQLCEQLPSLDGDLMLRAQAELEAGNPQRAGQLLDAVEQTDARWQLLRGRAYFGMKQYEMAADCLTIASSELPDSAYPLLEKAYREMQDYRQAYYYACLQRGETV